MTKAFCDGFEITFGIITLTEAANSKAILIDFIHSQVDDIIVKNILTQHCGGKAYLWITLSPESAVLTDMTLE